MALQKEKPIRLTADLAQNLQAIQKNVGQYSDFIYREILIHQKQKAVVIYLDGMTNKDAIGEFIIKPLLLHPDTLSPEKKLEDIAASLLFIPNIKAATTVEDFLSTIYSGDCGLLVDGFATGIVTDIKGFALRGISEPSTEIVVRGSREGFVENMKTNMTLLRRRIKTKDLAFENLTIGTETGTNLCLAYIRGLASPELIQEVKKRLQAIKIDGVLESGYLEQLLEDNPFSPFATIANSEKPDKVAAKLLEGRIAIITDGTPFVLTAPMLFLENFQSAEDYYSRPYFASMIRCLRFLAFLIGVFAPAVYVAIVLYHHEVIPYKLMLNMWQAEYHTPFNSGLSVLLITILYEIVREAGIRLPRPVGAAISIIGGLVIGDMVVSAGLISAPVVIIVAFTAIAMFVVDAMTDAATLLRIGFLLLAWFFGFFGIMIGILVLLVHLSTIESFGVPYFSPFAPFQRTEMRDSLFRAPLWLLGRRPTFSVGSKWRQREVIPPNTPEKNKPLVEPRNQ